MDTQLLGCLEAHPKLKKYVEVMLDIAEDITGTCLEEMVSTKKKTCQGKGRPKAGASV